MASNLTNGTNGTSKIFNLAYFGDDACFRYENGDMDMVIETNEIYGYLMSFLVLLQALLIFPANLLTILAVLKTPSLRTIPNTYVMSLAVADMLSGFLLFYEFVFRLPDLKSNLNENYFMCISIFCFMNITIIESLLCIVLISCERFVYICYPFKYQMFFSLKTVKISIAASWFVSISISLFPVISGLFETFNGCIYGMVSNDYYFYGIGIPFYSAMILCLILHIKIIHLAAHHRSRITSLSVGSTSKKPAAKSPITHHMKMVKTFLLIYTVFYICWLPWVTCATFHPFFCISAELMDVLAVVAMASGGINFIVYALLNHDFRKSFRNLLCGKCRSTYFEDSCNKNEVRGRTIHSGEKKLPLVVELRFKRCPEYNDTPI